MCKNRNEDMNIKVIVAVLAFDRASATSSGGLCTLSAKEHGSGTTPDPCLKTSVSTPLRSSLPGLFILDPSRHIVPSYGT